jgi:hypothetical protein
MIGSICDLRSHRPYFIKLRGSKPVLQAKWSWERIEFRKHFVDFSSYVFILWDCILSSGEGALSHSHSSLTKVLVYFGGWGGGELSTFQESLATHYSSPPPHPLPNQAMFDACFACLLAHNNAVHELANELSH